LEALYDAQDGDLISTLDVLREMQVWSRARLSSLRQAPLCQARPATDTPTPANGATQEEGVDLEPGPVQEPPPLDADNFPSLGGALPTSGVPGSSQPAPPAVAVPPSRATDAGTTPSGSRMHSQAMSMPHQAPPPQPFHPHHPQMRSGVPPAHMGQQMMHHQQMLPHPHQLHMQVCPPLPCPLWWRATLSGATSGDGTELARVPTGGPVRTGGAGADDVPARAADAASRPARPAPWGTPTLQREQHLSALGRAEHALSGGGWVWSVRDGIRGCVT